MGDLESSVRWSEGVKAPSERLVTCVKVYDVKCVRK